MATFDDICEAAGVDSCNCNSDMRAVITYMAEERPVLDQIPHSIKDEVHSWDGAMGLNLFEVYDSIKDRPSREIHQLIRYAVQRYSQVSGFAYAGFKELAWHFCVPLDNEDK